MYWWGIIVLLVLHMNANAMRRFIRENGKEVAEEDLAQSSHFNKQNGEYVVDLNETVAVLFNKKWIYAQVVCVPSSLSNHVGLLGRSKSLKYYKNWAVDFKSKQVKKLKSCIDESDA